MRYMPNSLCGLLQLKDSARQSLASHQGHYDNHEKKRTEHPSHDTTSSSTSSQGCTLVAMLLNCQRLSWPDRLVSPLPCPHDRLHFVEQGIPNPTESASAGLQQYYHVRDNSTCIDMVGYP